MSLITYITEKNNNINTIEQLLNKGKQISEKYRYFILPNKEQQVQLDFQKEGYEAITNFLALANEQLKVIKAPESLTTLLKDLDWKKNKIDEEIKAQEVTIKEVHSVAGTSVKDYIAKRLHEEVKGPEVGDNFKCMKCRANFKYNDETKDICPNCGGHGYNLEPEIEESIKEFYIYISSICDKWRNNWDDVAAIPDLEKVKVRFEELQNGIGMGNLDEIVPFRKVERMIDDQQAQKDFKNLVALYGNLKNVLRDLKNPEETIARKEKEREEIGRDYNDSSKWRSNRRGD